MQLNRLVFLFIVILLNGCNKFKVEQNSQYSKEILIGKNYQSAEITPSFYDNYGYRYKLNITKKVDAEGTEKFNIAVILREDKKLLNRDSKLKIIINGNKFFDFFPLDDGKVTAYNLDPSYVEDEIIYDTDRETLEEISNASKVELVLTVRDKLVFAKLGKIGIKQFKNFILNPN